MVRRHFLLVSIGAVIGLLSLSVVGFAMFSNNGGTPNLENFNPFASDYADMMDRTNTLFSPMDTGAGTSYDGFVYPHEYGCSTGEVVDIGLGKVVGYLVEDTKKDGKPGERNLQKLTMKDIDENSDYRLCTVVPFWAGLSDGLLLQEENPNLLVDVEKMNGHRFMKGVTEYAYYEGELGSADIGPSHYQHGIFPLDMQLTYRQLLTNTEIETYTLREVQDLMTVFPQTYSVSDLVKLAKELEPTLSLDPDEATSMDTLGGELVRKMYQKDVMELWISKFGSDYTDTFNIISPFASWAASLAAINKSSNFIGEGLATKVIDPLVTGFTERGEVLFQVPHTTTWVGSLDSVGETYERNLTTYLDDTLLLESIFPLFDPLLVQAIRPQADFFCKSVAFSPYGISAEEDMSMPFVTDAWKATCGSLSGSEHLGLGPFVDRSFANGVSREGTNMLEVRNYLVPKSLLAKESIGNKGTAGMDWFGAASHCVARGGRLPRMDELLYMASRDLAEQGGSPFFQAPAFVSGQGTLVWSGDFVTGFNTSDPSRTPYAMALYVPGTGDRSEVKLSGNEYVQCNTNWANPLNDETAYVREIMGAENDFSSASLLSNAMKCRVNLLFQQEEAKEYYETSSGDGTYLVGKVTNPYLTSDDVVSLPSGYPSDHEFIAPRGGILVDSSISTPTTYALCVYE